MEQKEMPDAILCADIHLMENNPICRLDDLPTTQWNKLDFIAGLQRKYECPVLHSGDLFHHWKPSPELLSKTIEHLPKDFYTVYGNHDLPQHSIKLAHKSGVYTLAKGGHLETLKNGNWGQTPEFSDFILKGKSILVWHVMTYQGKSPWPGCTAPKGAKLLRKHPYDLIVTGDNHKTFVEKHKGRLLVNPGSMLRTSAGQVEHKPCVFLYYAKTNTVEKVFIPIDPNVITNEHLETVNTKEEQLTAFISKLNTDWAAELSFEDNLEIFVSKNKVKKSIIGIINKAIDHE